MGAAQLFDFDERNFLGSAQLLDFVDRSLIGPAQLFDFIGIGGPVLKRSNDAFEGQPTALHKTARSAESTLGFEQGLGIHQLNGRAYLRRQQKFACFDLLHHLPERKTRLPQQCGNFLHSEDRAGLLRNIQASE